MKLATVEVAQRLAMVDGWYNELADRPATVDRWRGGETGDS